MPVSCLKAIAQRAAIRNIDTLRDVGEMPYDLVQPILRKIDNPNQLRHIEIQCPHIADSDAELWKAFIARDIPEFKTKIYQPKDPRNWWKVYRKLLREEKKAKEKQDDILRATMIGLDKKREESKTNIVNAVIPQPKRRQGKWVDGVRNPRVDSWGKERTPTLQNAKSGKDIIAAIRRQGSSTPAQKSSSATIPARTFIPSAKSQIKAAPEGMVRSHWHAPPRPLFQSPDRAKERAPGVFASSGSRTSNLVANKAPSVTDRALEAALKAEQAKKEGRIRALAIGRRPPPSPQSPTATSSGSGANTQLPAGTVGKSTVDSPEDTQNDGTRASVQSATRPVGKPTAHSSKDDLDQSSRSTTQQSPPPQLPTPKRRATSSVFMPIKKRKI